MPIDLLCSLTDNLQLLDYRGLNQLGASKLLLSALGELSNLTYSPTDVLEVKTFIPGAPQPDYATRERASDRIWSLS